MLNWNPFSWRVGYLGIPVTLALACVLSPSAAVSAHWPNFRGPELNGSSASAHVAERWSVDDGLRWSVDLPGPGSSTPAVWGRRLFLTAANADGELLAMCLDTSDGSVQWQRKHGLNRRHGRNDMTSPSPVTDGTRVIFLFGTGEMAAYDMDGARLWARDLVQDFGKFAWGFGYGASPLLHEGRLYVQMMRRPRQPVPPDGEQHEAFLLAIDPVSGHDLWRQGRPSDALDESWESYVTPTVHGSAEQTQIVIPGADTMTGHDPVDGRELWRLDFNHRRLRNWRLIPTPISDGRRIFCAIPRGAAFVAVDPGGAPPGVGLKAAAAWSMNTNAPDVCSPLLYDGRLYILDGDRRVVTCLDPETGRSIWRGQLGSETVIRASPTAADGKLFVMDEDGLVHVLAAGDEFRVITSIAMGGGQPARSSIVIVDGNLFVRTASALHRVAPVAIQN